MVKLVLIVTLMISADVLSCPNMCNCHNTPTENLYFTSVYCDVFNPDVAKLLSNTTNVLRLRGLKLEQVEDVLSDLEEKTLDLPYLVHLEFTGCEIRNVSFDRFNLEWVRSLALSDSRLREVPTQLSNFSVLQTLDLSKNQIESVVNSAFQTLGQLETLNLSANCVENLDDGSFSSLKSLKTLDLSQNKLVEICDEVFANLPSLLYLNLSGNQIERVNDTGFNGLVSLQHLDISSNKLKQFATGSLNFPNLVRLLISDNPLLGISRESTVLVGTSRKLQTVDASRTGLKDIPAALTHSIRTLRLVGNSVETVNCGDFDSYPLVQLLDMTRNKLEFVEEDALGRLDFLSILYLSDNRIRRIPKSLPEKLTALHLEHNDIERVSAKDLLGLASLEVLLLNDNKIKILDEGAFTQLTSLVTLDLSRNPITMLRPGCLSGPSCLQVLRLASIGTISPAEEVSFPLSYPEHLIALDLSDSPGLARQLLADTATLAASRELQELDLTRTDLERIRSDLLHYLPQLRVLHVKDNRLNCSQLHWLASWMRRQYDPEYGHIMCASPTDLWGTPLVDLQDPETAPIQAINPEAEVDSRSIINLSQQNILDPREKTPSSTSPRPTENSTTYTIRYDDDVLELENEIVDKEKHLSGQNEIANKEKQVESSSSSSSADKEKNDAASTSDLYSLTSNTINQAGEVAITRMPPPLKQTVAETDSRKPTSQNANETDESTDNKLDHGGFISEISRNLFVGSEDERTFNKSLSEKLTASEGSSENSLLNQEDIDDVSFQPGMVILGVGLVGVVAALVVLATKFTRKKRGGSNVFLHEDIEVNSLPSITELW